MNGSARKVATILATLIIGGAVGPAAQAQDLAREAAQPTLRANLDLLADDVAAEAFWDAEALRSLVADSIAPEDYEGVLKGAQGALLTGRANSADQALLLATLLDRALIPYRFATCELEAAPPVALSPTGTEPYIDVGEAASELSVAVEDPELREAIADVVGRWQIQRGETEAATAALAEALETMPADARAAVDAGTTASATRTHAWVQAASGAEWQDLDTTTPDGSAACEAAEVLDALPAEWAHQATIAIEVEQRRGGELETTDAFVYQVPTSEIASARVAVAFGEPSGLLEDTAASAPFGGGGQSALVDYTPVILVDGLVGRGTPVKLPPSSGVRANLGDTLVDITDTLFGEDDGADGPAEPDPWTGAWIRVELTDPDGQSQVMRSELFDRLGVAARTAGTAAEAPIEPLEEVDGEYADLSAIWQVGILLGDMSLPQVAYDGSLALDTVSGLSGHLDSVLRMFPTVYRSLGGHPSGPIVLVAGMVPTALADAAAPEAPQSTMRLVLDALHVPASAPADNLAAAQDAQALLGAEALLGSLYGEDVPSRGDSIGVLRGESPPALTAIGPDAVDALGDGLSPAAMTRMAERLAAGYWLLAPETPPADGTAWWFVDPRTGIVRDEHESGRHSTVEYSGQTANTLSRTERIRRAACKWAGPVIVAATIVFAINGGDAGAGKLLKAIAKTAQAAEEQRRRGEQARAVACAGTGGAAGPGG